MAFLRLYAAYFFDHCACSILYVPMPTLPASEPASCQCPYKEPVKWTPTNVAAHPPVLNSPLFRVGRNSHGDWAVEDESGRYGGIFVDRSEAVRYACSRTDIASKP